MSGLAGYLEQFEAKMLERGGHVYWAETAEDARKYVVELARKRDVKTVVKSKSMVTEEIHLSEALEAIGCTAWETDLGEFIVQLRKEPPYHIVTPAMHLTRVKIGELVSRESGGRRDNYERSAGSSLEWRATRIATCLLLGRDGDFRERTSWWPMLVWWRSRRTKATED